MVEGTLVASFLQPSLGHYDSDSSLPKSSAFNVFLEIINLVADGIWLVSFLHLHNIHLINGIKFHLLPYQLVI